MQSPLNTEFPNNIALVEAEASFTYAEVEQRTAEFASGLLEPVELILRKRASPFSSLPVLTM